MSVAAESERLDPHISTLKKKKKKKRVLEVVVIGTN